MTFQHFDLAPPLLSGIQGAGYQTPTPVQQQAIPAALQGRDLLALAQTGTGKTAAFMLPSLHRIITTPGKRGVRVLVLAPTRELAEQIHQASTVLAKHTKVRSATIYGGVGKGPQLAALRRGTEVIIACPGRLLDHIGENAIDLSGVQVVVLDEADTMCNMGFLPDVRRILAQLPKERQTLFFSATMPPDIRKLAFDILDNPAVLEIDPIAPAKTVSHALYPVPDQQKKKQLLFALLEKTPTGRALIFTRTKYRARTLARDLANLKYRVAAIQGNLSQQRRQEAMDGFRDGKYDLLVATDIAAHGIDVPEVSHVFNFDMPDTVDAYTHRIGRTGRASQTGEAFTLAVPEDAGLVREVEAAIGERIERRRVPGFDYGGFEPETQFPARQVVTQSQGQRYNGRPGRGPARPSRPRAPAATAPARSGNASNGRASSGRTPASPAPAVRASTGRPSNGQQAPGRNNAGQPSAGGPSAGRSAAGRTFTGRTSAGRSSTAPSFTGRPSTGRPSTGASSAERLGRSPTGPTSTGRSSTAPKFNGPKFIGKSPTGSTSPSGNSRLGRRPQSSQRPGNRRGGAQPPAASR